MLLCSLTGIRTTASQPASVVEYGKEDVFNWNVLLSKAGVYTQDKLVRILALNPTQYHFGDHAVLWQ